MGALLLVPLTTRLSELEATFSLELVPNPDGLGSEAAAVGSGLGCAGVRGEGVEGADEGCECSD